MKYCLAIFFACTLLFAEAETPFGKKWSVRGLIDYNFFLLDVNENESLQSNRPVEIGIGLGYQDFSFDFKYELPFTKNSHSSASQGIVFSTDYFPKNFWIKGWINLNSGFSIWNDNEDKEAEDVDFDYWDYGVKVIYITNKDHSPRAALFLDRQQESSGYSFTIGGAIKRISMRSKDSILNLKGWKHIDYAGPVAGLSFTHLLSNPKYFLGFVGEIGEYLGYQEDDGNFDFIQDIGLKGACGHIGESWAWSTVLGIETTMSIFNNPKRTHFHGFFKILVIRRF